MKKFMLSLCSILLAGAATAGPAFTITNTTGPGLNNPPFTLGWAFSTNSVIKVTALGLFDSQQNGLADSHEIGLWNSSGALLASGVVDSGTGNPLLDQFRYVDIGDVVLATGSYTIGALYLTGGDGIVFPGMATGLLSAPHIVMGNARFASAGTLTNPTIVGGDAGAYFGPNFQYDAVRVPEPGSIALLGLGLAAIGFGRRKLH